MVDKIREYDEVFTFRFQSGQPVPFLPGQYVHVLAPGSPPGRENIRHLSIASIPDEGWLQFSLDLGSSSDYKRKWASMEPGAKAHIFKVKGHFVLESPPPTDVIFVAGGIGITPVRSLIRHITTKALPVEWRLAHVARGPFLYESDLQGLGSLQKRIRRPDLEPLVTLWHRERPGARWYVSGSSRFVSGVESLLQALGVPEAQIRQENFE